MLKDLEAKIEQLISVVTQLKDENNALIAQNSQLNQKIESLETSMLKTDNDLGSLAKEKETTKAMIADLLKTIDTLVPQEEQS